MGCRSTSPAEVILKINGSNTIGAELMPAIVSGWLEFKGATDIAVNGTEFPEEQNVTAKLGNQNVKVLIESYGSSTGFTGLELNNCEIAMSSKPIPHKSKVKLRDLGNMNSIRSEHVIALDGIAIIVHPNSPLNKISMAQIQSIFSGEVTDWSELDSTTEGAIQIYRRDNNSGTHEVFKKLVMGKTGILETAHVVLDNKELVQKVRNDSGSIGYASVTFTGEAKSLGIVQKSGISVPTTFAVQTEDYPLSRRLYFYTAEKNSNPYVKDLVDYALARKGQALVAENGFVPQTLKLVTTKVHEEAPVLYRTEVEEALRFSMNFRFRAGTSSLDNRSLHDMKRLASFIERENLGGCSLKLFGFSDNMGAAQSNLRLSYFRAKTVSNLLQEQTGVDVDVVKGFGEIMPVASNADSKGRMKNRRVEVWIGCGS